MVCEERLGNNKDPVRPFWRLVDEHRQAWINPIRHRVRR
jgi:hypothetical protein